VKRWGLKDVLEIGPGFNFYFAYHLPKGVDYTSLDSEGFYPPEMLTLMRARLPRGRTLDGLIGSTSDILPDGSFDACVSVSVLEHLPTEAIAGACSDMFRILRPGGWAIHSLDLAASALSGVGGKWFDELAASGFLLPVETDFDLDVGNWRSDPPIAEPLSVVTRFSMGYRKSIWTKGRRRLGRNYLTPSSSRAESPSSQGWRLPKLFTPSPR
jgi:SAM-dependent methyltransferase